MALYQSTGGSNDSGGNIMRLMKTMKSTEVYHPGRAVSHFEFDILNFDVLRIGSAVTGNSPSTAKLQYSYDFTNWIDLVSGDKSTATTLDISGHHGQTIYLQLDVIAGSVNYANYLIKDVEMYKA